MSSSSRASGLVFAALVYARASEHSKANGEPALVSCVPLSPPHLAIGAGTMTDGKDQRTTITLEPSQVAVVLGMEGEELTRQLFASPEVDAVLDEDEADIP